LLTPLGFGDIGNLPGCKNKGQANSFVMDGRGQADRIILDARNQPGLTREIAERGARRAYGADNKSGGKIQNIQIIGDGFTIDIPRVP